VAGRRVTGVVLEADAETHVAERNPHAFAAPPDMDDLAREGQMFAERRHGLRGGFLFKIAAERMRTGGYSHICHIRLL
jgi:hypothetical protein